MRRNAITGAPEISPHSDKAVKGLSPLSPVGKQSTKEPTLLADVWVRQPQSREHGRAVPVTYLSSGGMGGGGE